MRERVAVAATVSGLVAQGGGVDEQAGEPVKYLIQKVGRAWPHGSRRHRGVYRAALGVVSARSSSEALEAYRSARPMCAVCLPADARERGERGPERGQIEGEQLMATALCGGRARGEERRRLEECAQDAETQWAEGDFDWLYREFQNTPNLLPEDARRRMYEAAGLRYVCEPGKPGHVVIAQAVEG